MAVETSAALDANLKGGEGERRQVRYALISSAIGTSIEWYDFFLYGTTAALVFPHLFFPKASTYAGTLAAFATYAVGFAARPIGAMIFGHIGDRLGRKRTLIVTLLLMGLSSVAIGFLPGHQAIGVWAAVLLVLLRVLQGIGVGGEWGGSVLLAMEWGHKRKRGFIASWPQFGVPVGLLLANGAVLGFSTLGNYDGTGLDAAWRYPFWFSAVIVAVGLFLRLRVLETPLFSKVVEEQEVEPQPVVQVAKRNWREIILTALVRSGEQAPFYIFTTFVLTYGHETLGWSKNFMVAAIMVAASVSMVSNPLFGHLSDRIGRRRMYLIGVTATALVAFPYFGLLQTGVAALVFITVILSLVPHDMQYGPQAALIAESFPTRLRYSGAGLGYQLASLTAGGPAPLIAVALLHNYGVWAIAGYIVAMCAVGFVATLLLPDRTRESISDDAVYEPRRAPARATRRRGQLVTQ
jgi:metabolite-proton symporter